MASRSASLISLCFCSWQILEIGDDAIGGPVILSMILSVNIDGISTTMVCILSACYFSRFVELCHDGIDFML